LLLPFQGASIGGITPQGVALGFGLLAFQAVFIELARLDSKTTNNKNGNS
jgi:hypothetical protein